MPSNPSRTTFAALASTEFIHPAQVDIALTRRGIKRGLYGWWFDSTLPIAPGFGCIQREGFHLMYVGIAPQNARNLAVNPMKNRLSKNHIHNGRIRGSTLRYSVAALLDNRFHFTVKRDSKNKPSMDRDEERRLSEWIFTHAKVSIVEHPAPWEVKAKILSTAPPLPLNIQMSRHPFKDELKQLRQHLGQHTKNGTKAIDAPRGY